MAADPEMDEPATMRDGYVFHVHFSPNIPSGRPSGTLTVKTGLPDFPQAQYTLFVQKGILASPDRVPLGLVSKPAYRSFLVSRPGKPFKVLSAESSSSYLNPLIIALPDSGDYRIDVDYNGKAPVGDFLATITVKTDDPKQPTIEVTVFGTIQ
jgi:hypothetical protein